MTFLGLAVAALLLLVLVSVVVATLFTGMSPMPSHARARKAMLEQVALLADSEPKLTLVDLGSGWGHLVVPLAQRFPQHQVVGYELSFFPWLLSWLLKKGLRLHNLTLYRKNFLKADLSAADVLLCYLVAPVMQQLAQHLEEMQPRPRWLISHFFRLPGWQPRQQLQLRDLYLSPIYVYCLEK